MYFVTYHPEPLDWSYYRIIKWYGISYKEIYWGYTGINLDKMICDGIANDVKVFNTKRLLFSDSVSDSKPVTHFDWLDVVQIDNLSYNLYSYASSENGDEVQKYLLTICERDKPETCEYVPIEHSSYLVDNEDGDLMLDIGTKELYILFDGKIYAANGNRVNKFDTLAFEKKYYVAGYANDRVYTYILYACIPYSGEGCDSIPFSYSTAGRQDVALRVDKYLTQTHKLSVYIGNKLVFVYDVVYDKDKCQDGCPQPQCLVDGCYIPGK